MIQFLVHEHADNVGVATVDIKAGETASGLYMDSQKKVRVKAQQDIPLGHKIALTKFKKEFVAVSKPEAVFSGRGDSEPRGSLLKKAKDEVKRILGSQTEPAASRDELEQMDALLKKLM